MRRESLLLRIDVEDDPVRYWSGVGWLDIPADAVEPEENARYLGGGSLISLPDLDQLINDVAQRASIDVSGVSYETVRLVTELAEQVKDSDVHIGRAIFDSEWQLSAVQWIGTLRADKLTTTRSGQSSVTRGISLSIGTENTSRSKAPIALWTPADQAKFSTGDRFFDNVPSIEAGTSRRFRTKEEL